MSIPRPTPPLPHRARHGGALVLATMLAALAPLGATAAPATRYQVIDLGAGVTPTDINADGTIVGTRRLPDNSSIGFRYTAHGGLEDLAGTTSATAVDADGRIVGRTSGGGSYVFDGTLQPLDPSTLAFGLNDLGQAAGGQWGVNPYASSPLPLNPAVLDLASRQWQVLDIARVYPRGTQQGVYADLYAVVDINDAGWAVGNKSRTGLYGSAVFVMPPSHDQVDFMSPPGGGTVAALNNRQQAVGTTLTDSAAGTYAHAYRLDLDTGAFTDLGTLGAGLTSAAADLNDAGQVVGSAWLSPVLTSTVDPTLYHAFFWEDGVMHDLNDHIGRQGRRWLVTGATAINGSGHIVGVGLLGGVSHGVWLQPRAR
jgi:probable HAF family extracellular repeat protein